MNIVKKRQLWQTRDWARMKLAYVWYSALKIFLVPKLPFFVEIHLKCVIMTNLDAYFCQYTMQMHLEFLDEKHFGAQSY